MASQPIAKFHANQLEDLKASVNESREFFSENYKMFTEFRRFVFISSLSQQDANILTGLQKPILEFNILEPYISRLCGEFSKQQPDMEVNSTHDTPTPIDVKTIQVVDGILRGVLDKAQSEGECYEVFKDLMAGGFSAFEVYTEYAHEKSFQQRFCVKRVFDPTMCGWDPLSRLKHKGDGKFCYSLYPKLAEEVAETYPDAKLDDIKYATELGGFNWAYKNQAGEKIVLLCDHYVKRKKRTKILRLSNGMTVTQKEYKKIVDYYEQVGSIRIPPIVVDERWTEIEVIWRYVYNCKQVLEEEETDYKYLPIIFVDGNSECGRDSGGNYKQTCRPLIYHARDIQRLKNFAGQSLANELENIIQHKYLIAKESIPEAYKETYKDIQHQDNLVYNFLHPDRPEVQLPAPVPINRTPIPPEISNTFGMADQMTQVILGTFDVQMGALNNSQLSGKAIVESISNSNSVSMPYIVGYLNAWQQVANCLVDLIPKYMKTPQTIPIMDKENKRQFMRINDDQDPNSVSLDYDDNALHVVVKPGVNFSIQKSRALQQIISLMQVSPMFAQFMNQEGLNILLDNIEIRGIDELRLLSNAFMEQIKQQQAMAQQQAQQQAQSNPEMMKLTLEQQKLQQEQVRAMQDFKIKEKQAQIAEHAENNNSLRIMLDARQAHDENVVSMAKTNTERFGKAADLALKTNQQHHDQNIDKTNLAHQILNSIHEPIQTGDSQNG